MKSMLPFVALLFLAQDALPSDDGGAVARRRGKPAASAVVVVGGPPAGNFITYDTGSNAGFPADVGQKAVGNRFNTIEGYGLKSHNAVTRVTVFPQNDGVQSISFWAAPNSMNSAMALPVGWLSAPLMGGVFNQIVISPEAIVPADFIVTFIGAIGGTPPGLVGLDANMTAMAHAFHAVQGYYNNGNLTMIQAIPGRNAMLRLRGDFYLPVELLEFQIQ
ncbi:MAG: hypothetical protein ABW221_14155 [Vicinamibacteria bacterium]